MGNVTKEILEPFGGLIDLRNVRRGDKTLSSTEVWVSESQEQNTVLIARENIQLVRDIARRERVPLEVVGLVSNTGRVTVTDESGVVVSLPLEGCEVPRKTYHLELEHMLEHMPPTSAPNKVSNNDAITAIHHEDHQEWLTCEVKRILRHPDVCSKRFLTTKVDRSVGGLVAQQQAVGPLHTALADVAVIAHSHFDHRGAATAIGERPLIGLTDVRAMARMAVGEMLTNICFAPITRIEDIKCSGNWMWPAGSAAEKAKLLAAATSLSEMLQEIGVAIDGGKDSVSMTATVRGRRVDAPPSLVISGYAPCTDVRRVVTPELRGGGSVLILVETTSSRHQQRLGNSIFHGRDKPNIDSPDISRFGFSELVEIFNGIQFFLNQGIVLAGHDRSDGGLITTVAEMCFASGNRVGVDLTIDSTDNLLENTLFNEEIGVVIDVSEQHEQHILDFFNNRCAARAIGRTNDDTGMISIGIGRPVWSIPIVELRDAWESTASALEERQLPVPYARELVRTEHKWLCQSHESSFGWHIPATIETRLSGIPRSPKQRIYRVAIVRDAGSNGEREMAAAFHHAGFQVHDVHTSDLVDGRTTDLSPYRGIVFVGGFTYADALGAATGWCAVLTRNETARNALQVFVEREDTFVLGVCNGCQLLSQLGWLGSQHTFTHNTSGRFESRFSTVRVSNEVEQASPVFFPGMAGLTMGVWVAHGEGRYLPSSDQKNGEVLHYVHPESGEPTESYPHNPNGSTRGVAGVISPNGRIFALMPHPERSVLNWQLPWNKHLFENFTPWMMFFRNALLWCEKEKN
jgi:phosphoribosylformylglycinamidine synthase